MYKIVYTSRFGKPELEGIYKDGEAGGLLLAFKGCAPRSIRLGNQIRACDGASCYFDTGLSDGSYEPLLYTKNGMLRAEGFELFGAVPRRIERGGDFVRELSARTEELRLRLYEAEKRLATVEEAIKGHGVF